MRFLKSSVVLVAVAALASACGGASASGGKSHVATELRLGYFPNITHASAVYGVASGVYQQDLGSTKLTTQTFNAGPAEVEALFAGSLDAGYLGPGPAVNAFIKSHGDFVVVAGATSGGAQLVVRAGVTALKKGLKLADPQTGGTQDIALRTYLASKGFKVDKQGGGPIQVIAEDNAQTLDLFKGKQVDGAWVPEPWASRLVLDGKGKVLVDEKTLWPQQQFVTTNLIVRKAYLQAHPDTIKALLRGQQDANTQIAADPAKAKTVINAALKTLTGKSLKPKVIERALSDITLTLDPLASTLKQEASNAFATGLVKSGDLKGIYDLTLVDAVAGKQFDDAGLGKG